MARFADFKRSGPPSAVSCPLDLRRFVREAMAAIALRDQISRRLVFDASAPQCITTPARVAVDLSGAPTTGRLVSCAARRASRHYKTRYKTLTLTPKFANDFNVKQKYRRFPAVRTNWEMPSRPVFAESTATRVLRQNTGTRRMGTIPRRRWRSHQP
jgi:hypothetical protein